MRALDPRATFSLALDTYDREGRSRGVQFIRGLLSGIDMRDRAMANECIQMARGSFQGHAINLYTAVSITAAHIPEIVAELQQGRIGVRECAFLSYGRGLDALNAAQVAPLICELLAHHETEGTWTALEIISMYQHGRETLDPAIEDFIKKATTSEYVFKATKDGNRDGYVFESLVDLLRKRERLDDTFALALAGQIVRLCQVKDYGVYQALDDAMRKVASLLVSEKPLPVLEVVARFYEVATASERHALERLMRSPADGFDGLDGTRPGVLVGLPEEQLVEWVKGDPQARIPFLCSFYPVLAVDAGGSTWHPAMERLALEFGSVEAFREALALRLHPSSWSGSIVPHLQIYLAPLEKWLAHQVPELSLWAREMHRSMKKQIEWERRREQEQ